MKKISLGVLAAFIALSIGTTTAFAAGSGSGCYFTDADGNGICDNCGVAHWCGTADNGCGTYFTDADGNGICDNCGVAHWCGTADNNCKPHSGCGKNYVDANGDGICDNCVSIQSQSNGCGHGSYSGHGSHGGHGHGCHSKYNR